MSRESAELNRQFENEEFLLYRLSSAGRRVSALCAEQYMAEFGLGVAEWRLLAQIGRFGRVTARDVIRITSMDKVSVSRAVNKCLGQGLIRETTGFADRRVKQISFTPAGESFYAAFLPRAVDLARRVEEALDPEEIATLKRLLKKLDDHVAGLRAGTDSSGEDVA